MVCVAACLSPGDHRETAGSACLVAVKPRGPALRPAVALSTTPVGHSRGPDHLPRFSVFTRPPHPPTRHWTSNVSCFALKKTYLVVKLIDPICSLLWLSNHIHCLVQLSIFQESYSNLFWALKHYTRNFIMKFPKYTGPTVRFTKDTAQRVIPSIDW